MGIGVFGPLRLEGVSLSPRERIVLSALVLRGGRPTTTDELADAVWRDDPPETWPKQLQISIARIRAAIGRDAIETSPGRYTLRIDPDTVDAERFERFASSARDHLEGDDPARAVDAADRALALWRGTPYADLTDWPSALVEAERLDEVRLDVEEVRLAARLRLGEHAAAVADAERLVREAPLRERRWTTLATALYRSGRQADALSAIRSAKERLANDLGAEPGEELQAVEVAVLRHDDSLDLGEAPRPASDACPYRGLAPFGVEDEDDFFGRASDTTAALARLARSRFLAISGASGSGKSSLVRAGLIPALRRRGDRVALLVPERDLDVHVRDALWGARRADVIVVDQFEEVFHAGEADVDAAAGAIAEAAACGTTVVLVVRSDFLDDCAAHPDLAPLVAEGVHLVGPMAPDALREAIEQPARRAGLRLEPGLVELLLRDAAGEAGALPHLSHALVETWLRREGGTLTVAGYEASGGISGAIAQSADRLYQSMDAEQRALCRSVLLRLVALAPDGTPVRRRVPSRPLRTDAAREDVLSLLSRERLISAEAESVEVAHESLATAWPRLQSWLAEDAESTRLLNAVSAASEAWAAAGRPADDLYRGARLQSALEWRDAAPRDLTDIEAAFLDESAARATAERDELAERARRDRSQNRRLRSLLIVAASLIVLLVGAGSVAVAASREAAAQRDSATIEALVGSALSLRGSERDVSALLAAEAYRRWPEDPRTRAALMGVLQGAGGFIGNAVIDGTQHSWGAAIPGSANGLVVTSEGDLSIRDLATAEVVSALDLGFDEGPVGPVLVDVSPDGRVGAVLWTTAAESPPWIPQLSIASRLVIVDVAEGRRSHEPIDLPIGAGALAIEADGSTIAVASAADGAITLVSSETAETRPVSGERLAPLDTDTIAAAAAFTSDGELLVGRLGAELEVIDPDSATVIRRVAVPETSANQSISVTRSGNIVASGATHLISVDPDSGELLWSTDIVDAPFGPCHWVAGAELVDRAFCGNRFGRITLFDLTTGAATGEEIAALLGDVGPMDISEDGRVLVAFSGTEAAISRWKLDGRGATDRLIAPDATAIGGYSYEGSSIVAAPQQSASVSQDVWNGAAVIDTETGEPSYFFREAITDVAWITGRRVIALHESDGMYHAMDADTGSTLSTSLELARFWVTDAGTRVQAMGTDGSITPLDAADLRPVDEPLEVEGWPIWFAKSPDGARISVSSFGEPELAPDGTVVQTRVAIMDSDASRIISSGPLGVGGTVLLDNGDLIGLEDNRIGRYRSEGLDRIGALTGTAGGLGIPTLSTDGRTLLITAADGTAMLYDLPSGIRIGEPIRMASGSIGAGHLRPDGLEMALSMRDGVVVWDLDPDHQFDAVCRIAGRELTTDEWRTYLADLGPQQPTCGFAS
ncbi:BTAD domain-containing putative transcriptional regulator [Agromyces sp. GXS1127]|uniref:nSTAND1 domain-containing NTPase n=1 Tax=Agromyces sp. GXS1127 TaxID=3424181 RepID=UPI003D317841